ncbi:MAG: serine/threonine-protein kinase, partial [Planctomycetota bacterium]|nr:serine/threonine-protein kinase [Planctomycetota bacterium]
MNQDHRIAQQIIQFNFVNPQLVQQAMNSPHRQPGQDLCAFLCQAGYLTPQQAQQVQASLHSSPNLQHTLVQSQGAFPAPQEAATHSDDKLYAAHFDKVIVQGEKLGQGGMGVVYRVVDKRLDRPAALKLLHKDSQNKLSSTRFLREASITARLDHPCIPPVYEVGKTPSGELYLLMRIIEGETLTKLIDEYHENQRPAKALNEILDILIKVCEAMDYAHGHSILHRDLKPDNIMVGPFGEALVLDWGLARDMKSQEEELPLNQGVTTPPESQSTKLTQAGALIGTL